MSFRRRAPSEERAQKTMCGRGTRHWVKPRTELGPFTPGAHRRHLPGDGGVGVACSARAGLWTAWWQKLTVCHRGKTQQTQRSDLERQQAGGGAAVRTCGGGRRGGSLAALCKVTGGSPCRAAGRVMVLAATCSLCRVHGSRWSQPGAVTPGAGWGAGAEVSSRGQCWVKDESWGPTRP